MIHLLNFICEVVKNINIYFLFKGTMLMQIKPMKYSIYCILNTLNSYSPKALSYGLCAGNYSVNIKKKLIYYVMIF